MMFRKALTAGAAMLLAVAGSAMADSKGGPCGEAIDMAIAMDQTGSISTADFDTARTAVANFITESSEANPDNRYFVLYYSLGNIVEVASPLATNADDAAAEAVRNQPATAGGANNDPEALARAAAALPPSSRPRVMIYLTDGIPAEVPEAEAIAAAQKVKDAGITLVTIAIGNPDEAFLEDLASVAPDGSPYFFNSLEFEELAATLDDALLSVCPDITAPTAAPEPDSGLDFIGPEAADSDDGTFFDEDPGSRGFDTTDEEPDLDGSIPGETMPGAYGA